MKKLIAILLVLFSVIFPTGALAFDIPLLTWERGRIQQVVLGGGAASASFTVQLEGNGIQALTFTASTPNGAGYVVYSLDIPADLPVGAYSVATEGVGSPRTVVAGVALVEARLVTVATSSLLDLTKILSLFIFLTAIISAMRARKYSQIQFNSTQSHFESEYIGLLSDRSFLNKLSSAPYRIRVNGLLDFRISLLRFLLIREGELIHRVSKSAYGFLPLIAILSGVIAGIETNRNSGIALTPISIFVGVALLAIFDAYSGLFATLSFWALMLFTGNVTSVRDVLLMAAVGLSWVGPSLFSSLTQAAIQRDFPKSKEDDTSLNIFAVVGSSVIGASVFYLGQTLVDSIIYTDKIARSYSVSVIAIIAAAIVVRQVADALFTSRPTNEATHLENFYIARVSSPQMAVLVSILIFGFVYIWTQSASIALVAMIGFSIPYYLVFIKLSVGRIQLHPKRNVLLEAALTAAIAFIIYGQISDSPWLIDQQASWLLLLCAIPGLIHAAYSAICSSSEM